MADLPAALVTGGAHRIGRAIVTALADAGHPVVIHYHTAAREAEQLAASLRKRRRRVAIVQADMSDAASVDGLLARARRALGRRPTILVNNAAAYPEGSSAQLGAARASALQRLNVAAPVALANGLKAVRGACVVNILDARMYDDDPRHAAYLETKRQLAAATKRLAVEGAPLLRVNGVAPGAILPEAGGAWSRAVVDATVLGRTASPEDVAQAVVFLATASAVTGQILYVDGGRHLKPSARQA